MNFGGHASKATVSPTRAERCLSYSHRIVFSLAWTPMAVLLSRVPDLRSASSALLLLSVQWILIASDRTTYLCHLTYPLLIISISPCFSFVPCHFSVSSISMIGISCLETANGAFPFFSSYHLNQSHSTPLPTMPPLSHQLCVPLVSVCVASACVSPL